MSEDETRVVECFVEALSERLGDGLRSVWLFGSRARGEQRREYSDVDMLVVSDGGSKHDGPIVNEVLCQIAWAEDENPHAFTTVVWSPEWLAHRREIRSFFVQEVDRDKIVLFGEP